MTPRRILIDCDPGQDDAVAILVALASPELEVVAVTTVAGNVALDVTTRNALRIVEHAGRSDVPVHAGCDRPLLRSGVDAAEVHGADGLDGAKLDDPAMVASPVHAVDAIIKASHEGPLTICALGPLTNVASALRIDPTLHDRIERIVLMGGGGRTGGNVTAAAEFNIHVDPHAAAIVFDSGVPITMVPLDVTHRVIATPERVDRFRSLGSPVAETVAGLLSFFDRYDERKYGQVGGPLHDPCVISALVIPEAFGGRECRVDIEVSSELTMGMTVIDWWGVSGLPANALVLDQVDADAVFDDFVVRIATY